MMRSLYSGVSGLRTHQGKMDVIGNNIANVNTVAFKSTAVTFNDIMYQTTQGASGATDTKGGVNAKQVGLGVAQGSTKISITSAGASESTGNAFDIKLTDSQSTNFFIVNNGTETLFTRAGSFYVDGNGNLAMTSTGYLVQGWQVDPETLDIRRDTVSPLRIMSPENMTSAPEATTNATVSGVIDRNSTTVSSEKGYAMSLNFYDNLGYSYTAKFAVKLQDNANPTNGKYTVELTNIYDSNNKDVLAEYVNSGTATEPHSVQDIFGTNQTWKKSLSAVTPYKIGSPDLTKYTAVPAGQTSGLYVIRGSKAYFASAVSNDDGKVTFGTTGDTFEIDSKNVFGVDVKKATTGTNQYATNASFDAATGVYTYDYTGAVANLEFNTADGTFSSISTLKKDANGQPVTNGETDSGNSTVLNLTNLKNAFGAYFDNMENIDVDFSTVLNYDNGGTSTMGIEKGSVDNAAIGYGKKLGVLTGVSVDGTGRIYGSYDNGNTDLLGQIAVAQFSNASGLESLGNNCYATTLNSGDFDGIGVEVSADGGSMATGQLEMSNVDLSQEFTSMITTQRGFQANSRIITVSDTMLEELTNLKR